MSDIRPIAWEDLTLGGDLGRRSQLSFQRLEDYTPAFALPGNVGWPADKEGRAVLGQVLIGRTVHSASTQTALLLAGMPIGVLGPTLDLAAIDEQQISGHSWLLRGLCEHYTWRHQAEVLTRIRRIVDDLFLPLSGRFAGYPIDPVQRGPQGGGPTGEHLGGTLDGWRLSSDIGCAFIGLDGLTHAYELDPRPAVARLIEEIIARFRELDPVAVGNQTHATLTCLRALLRWHRLFGRPELLAHVQRLFDTYLDIASTEQHQNWNWFGRPQWTEPCAVVDAFEIAVGLWRATNDSSRLAAAQEILFTGLARQRHNGGYGCDICTGALGQTAVAIFQDIYESHWCCTMRGAEGWARAAEHSWCLDGARVRLPWQSDSTAVLRLSGGTWTVRQSSRHPEDGTSVFTVVDAPADGRLELLLYVAPWVDRSRVTGVTSWDGDWAVVHLPAQKGAPVIVELPFGLRRQPALGDLRGTHVSFRHGPLLLGVAGQARPVATLGHPVRMDGVRYRAADGSVLAPVSEATWLSEVECRTDVREVLFAI
jgi:hypothetical protein